MIRLVGPRESYGQGKRRIFLMMSDFGVVLDEMDCLLSTQVPRVTDWIRNVCLTLAGCPAFVVPDIWTETLPAGSVTLSHCSGQMG